MNEVATAFAKLAGQRLKALRAGADDPSLWRNAALLDLPQG
jgi:hypothetical protein